MLNSNYQVIIWSDGMEWLVEVTPHGYIPIGRINDILERKFYTKDFRK